MCSNDKWYEYFNSSLLSYLDLCHTFSQEYKISCLQKLITELEIEQEAQRMSQYLSHKTISCEDLYDQK
jgi:hypothetical protein